jgi:CheY-like chemotaxis protein
VGRASACVGFSPAGLLNKLCERQYQILDDLLNQMPHILVADDDDEQIAVQRRLLEALGYRVGTASSPADTLRELQRSPPDLIIVDLRFPLAADGLTLIRGIRQTGCRLPVIVLSGWPDDLYGTPEEQLVSRILVKGCVRELLQTIEELLAG